MTGSPMQAPLGSVLADPAFLDDPYPTLAAIRELGPLPTDDVLGVRLAASWSAASEVLRSRDLGRTFSLRGRPGDDHRWDAFDRLHLDALLEVEPPTHTRLRRLVAAAFGRGHVERLRPRVQELADGLLDGLSDGLLDGLPDGAAGLADDGSFDVVAGFAEPLPVLVIGELLGWPAADIGLLRPWSQAIVAMYELDPTPAAQLAAQRAAADFAEYVAALATERSRRPGTDLISDLVAVRDAGDRLSQDELVATVVLLLNAGHEASVNALGNGLVGWLAADSPGSGAGVNGQAGGWSAGDAGVDSLVEEMLRFDAPLQLFERTARRDCRVAGVDVSAGERVVALLGAANRDPARFTEPDVFDPGRGRGDGPGSSGGQLAFGAGIHFCLGAPLARLELQTAVSTLLTRWPQLEVTGGVRRPSFVLRGWSSLRVRPR